MSNQSGTLFVVATPIGNLADISQRALDVLNQVDLIAAEDTRHSRKLLQALGIKAHSLLAYHDHNENELANKLCERLLAGEQVALISDAGTPLISDPGYRLVQACHQRGLRVEPIPGASALLAALSVSGLPTDKFIFEGFLPAKSEARLKRLQALANEARTLIFYESKHRILEALRAMSEVFSPQRRVCLARELTKSFETVLQATIAELLQKLEDDANQRKGEFVLVVAGFESPISADVQQLRETLAVLLTELPLKKAVQVAANILKVPRNQVYSEALEMKRTKE